MWEFSKWRYLATLPPFEFEVSLKLPQANMEPPESAYKESCRNFPWGLHEIPCEVAPR